MHFNIYLDDETGKKLTKAVKRLRTTRNAVIRQAISEWLATRGRKQWSEQFMNFTGVPEMPPFESHRADLIDQSSRDPFK